MPYRSVEPMGFIPESERQMIFNGLYTHTESGLKTDRKLAELHCSVHFQSTFSPIWTENRLDNEFEFEIFFDAVRPLKVSPSFFRNAVVLFIIRHGHPVDEWPNLNKFWVNHEKHFRLVSQCMSNQRRQKQKYLLMLLEYVLMLPCAHDQLPSEKPTCARVLRIWNRSFIPLLTLKNVTGSVGAPHWSS